MPIRIDLFEGETPASAFRRLKRVLQRECVDDRTRLRAWRVGYYEKPGYVRRQQKFFAKVNARKWASLLHLLQSRGIEVTRRK